MDLIGQIRGEARGRVAMVDSFDNLHRKTFLHYVVSFNLEMALGNMNI